LSHDGLISAHSEFSSADSGAGRECRNKRVRPQTDNDFRVPHPVLSHETEQRCPSCLSTDNRTTSDRFHAWAPRVLGRKPTPLPLSRRRAPYRNERASGCPVTELSSRIIRYVSCTPPGGAPGPGRTYKGHPGTNKVLPKSAKVSQDTSPQGFFER